MLKIADFIQLFTRFALSAWWWNLDYSSDYVLHRCLVHVRVCIVQIYRVSEKSLSISCLLKFQNNVVFNYCCFNYQVDFTLLFLFIFIWINYNSYVINYIFINNYVVYLIIIEILTRRPTGSNFRSCCIIVHQIELDKRDYC